MFYFLNIVIVLYNLLLYAIFRSGIYDYLRLSKMSKTNIKQSCRGFKNYWLYQASNIKTPLGILYNLNCIFLVSTTTFSVLALLLGYIKAVQPILFTLSILLCIVEIPTTGLASAYSTKAEFGKRFVFLAKRKDTGKFCSSVVDMFSWCITALLIYLSYLQL